MSQRKLAERSGVSKTTILKIESGKTIPQMDTIYHLAIAMDMEPHDLFDQLLEGEAFTKLHDIKEGGAL